MRNKHHLIQPSRSHHGYVLVMALVLIAMAASVLAIMAKRSVFDASDVLHAQAQFKEHWAAYSLSKSLLPQAREVMALILEKETLLESTPDQQPISVVHFEVQLGGLTYQLALADEQAKANVNQLLKNKGNSSDTAQAIRNLMNRTQIADIPVIELKPYTWKENPNIAKLHTLGQIFKNVTPSKLCSTDSEEKEALDVLTCWGDGKLNFHTAPPEVMLAVCNPTLGRGQIDKLIAARQRNPKISLDAALTAAGIAKDHLAKIKKMFTDESTCYSLWVHRQTQRQTHHWLTIAQQQKSLKNQPESSPESQQSGKIFTTVFEW